MKYCDTCHNTYPTDFATCPKDQAVLRAMSELAPGMVLRGKYRIDEKIGEGGMASVYRASHLHFNEELAIKVVNSALSGNQDFLDRFKREAVITRKLRHPNAVRLDDFDITEDGRPFIAMEYVRGKSLRTVLEENGRLPIPRAFDIARQVALALGAAHQLRIVHRDIKPENVLLVPQADGSDRVKVLDFGIAKTTGEQLQSGSGYKPTATGMVLGTPHYLSPEQARGKKSEQIDGRADLYALGVLLYEMVTGELPFKSDTAIEMLLHHIQTAPVPTHLLKPEMHIPEPVSAVIMKALEKDPANRFASGEIMAQALNDVCLASGGAAGAFNKPAASASRVGTPAPAFDSETCALGSASATIETPVSNIAAGPVIAAGGSSQPAASAPRAAAVATPPPTAEIDSATRVLGSASATMQTPVSNIAAGPVIAPPAQSAPAPSVPAKKKSKRWLVWSAAAVTVFGLLVGLSVWGGFELANRNNSSSAAQQTDDRSTPTAERATPTTPNASAAPNASPTPAPSPDPLSALDRLLDDSSSPSPSSQSKQTLPAVDQATQARAQKLVVSGNAKLKREEFAGAQSDFQKALKLDPNNQAAQNGLDLAQAGLLAKGLDSILKH
jgi:serine/threonine protein kinase